MNKIELRKRTPEDRAAYAEGFASCYWDTPPRKIYPRDFWCKLGEAETDGGVN